MVSIFSEKQNECISTKRRGGLNVVRDLRMRFRTVVLSGLENQLEERLPCCSKDTVEIKHKSIKDPINIV